jgi:lysophospholipase L1-like esterase
MRSSGEFDAVIDFDAAVRDPAAPTQLWGSYDSGDHLHPSDAGHSAMANAINLHLFGL